MNIDLPTLGLDSSITPTYSRIEKDLAYQLLRDLSNPPATGPIWQRKSDFPAKAANFFTMSLVKGGHGEEKRNDSEIRVRKRSRENCIDTTRCWGRCKKKLWARRLRRKRDKRERIRSLNDEEESDTVAFIPKAVEPLCRFANHTYTRMDISTGHALHIWRGHPGFWTRMDGHGKG